MKLKIITICEKKIKKENNELQRAIIKATKELGNKIIQFYKSGVVFNQIFNVDSIKYDKHGNCFTYKAHGKNKSQLRILYSCFQNIDTTYIIVVDYTEKRKAVNKGCRDHIDKFSKYDNLDFNMFCLQNNITLVT